MSNAQAYVVTHGEDVLRMDGRFVVYELAGAVEVFTSRVRAERMARRFRGAYVANWPPTWEAYEAEEDFQLMAETA